MDKKKILIFSWIAVVSCVFGYGLKVFVGNAEGLSKNGGEKQTASLASALGLSGVSQNLPADYPEINPGIQDPQIGAESAISVWVDNSGGQEKVLFQKNADEQLLIASLTKLMTADIVLENYNLSDTATISKAAVDQGGDFNAGEVFTVDTLLHAMLIMSDNSAAFALAEKMGTDKFVSLMNQKAKDIGLSDTYYSNSVGYGTENHSSVKDMVKLAKYIYENKPSIFQISITPEANIYNLNGTLHHKIKSTDLLFADSSVSWKDQIIGSKTGTNDPAGECLVLLIKSPDGKGYIINVILKSEDRFGEIKNLVNWLYSSYNWNY